MSDHIESDDRVENEAFPHFTCEHCGSHNLRVVRAYTVHHSRRIVLPCRCEDPRTDEAAYRITFVLVEHRDEGYPTEGMGIEWEDRESFKVDSRHETTEVHCRECHDLAQPMDWVEDDDFETVDVLDDSEVSQLICAGCRREVTYG